jgi:hypothetical protein
MSEFLFRIPADWELNSQHMALIHVIGLDGIPAPCKVRVDRTSEAAKDGAIIHIARNLSESGHVYFLFPHPDRGEMLLSTGTLPISEAAYDLLKELARGTLNRLRNQLSIWEEGGLQIADHTQRAIPLAVHDLAQAIMAESPAEQDQFAFAAISRSVNLIFEVASQFGLQISRYRCEHPEMPVFWAGATIPSELTEQPVVKNVDRHFDCLRIQQVSSPPEFVEADANPTIPLIVGPLLDASQGGLPPFLVAAGDHTERRKIILGRLRGQLEQLPENVSLIHLMSGLNGIGHRHLSYPQQTQLAVDMLQMIDESLVEVPVMISFDFPWAERLAGAVGGVHPLQIADSILRQGVPISYFGLEVNLDYAPCGSVVRDPLQWIDLIDIWNQLEIPVVILLRAPFCGCPAKPEPVADRLVNQQRSNLTDAQRADYLRLVLQLLVARPLVQGVIWSQWSDESDLRFPNGGLIHSSGIKPPLEAVFSELHQLLAMRRNDQSANLRG